MPGKTSSILLGGGVAAILSILFSVLQIPYLSGCLGCLAYLIAGLAAVWHYTETHSLTVSGGTGAGMGAGAGAVAGLLVALVTFAFWATGLLPTPTEALDQLSEAGTFPPEQLEAARNLTGSPIFYLAYAGVFALLGAILGAIGGVIGASVFKRGGDTPGGGRTGGGPGGPRTPAGSGPAPGGPTQARTPEREPQREQAGRTASSPSRAAREEETAAPSSS